jgi:hypothetical protein
LSKYRKRSGVSSYFHYHTLPKFKWSSLIKEKMLMHSKLPGTWTFTKHKISNDLINLRGKCSQCSAECLLFSSNKTDHFQEFVCTIQNFDKMFKHNPKKRSRLTPYRRKQIAKELRHKSAIKFHTEIASTLMSDTAHKVPPVLPSLSAIRKIKFEARHKNLPHANPVFSLYTIV